MRRTCSGREVTKGGAECSDARCRPVPAGSVSRRTAGRLQAHHPTAHPSPCFMSVSETPSTCCITGNKPWGAGPAFRHPRLGPLQDKPCRPWDMTHVLTLPCARADVSSSLQCVRARTRLAAHPHRALCWGLPLGVQGLELRGHNLQPPPRLATALWPAASVSRSLSGNVPPPLP